jgi:dTDP-4-dehydrorhamnose 3,5-epimerase-like enzyme
LEVVPPNSRHWFHKFDGNVELQKRACSPSARGMNQSNVPKNNIIVLTIPPSIANNPPRLGKATDQVVLKVEEILHPQVGTSPQLREVITICIPNRLEDFWEEYQ